ncbi:hypothetical protein [Leucobacter tenebrionis]|uniref:hypothetical protein n=1 Tax=Leucobacter tenebrionis TaxID=2873270 RepID=UPI001CA67053|nr:hypothetical protein [Leucobacter tenebrionis]QZY52552.1 hypothetical protein KVY00_03565 [Leucobacter tenebrionis]
MTSTVRSIQVALSVIGTVGAATLLSGCTNTEQYCTAVGHPQTLLIAVEGDEAASNRVTQLLVCGRAGCDVQSVEAAHVEGDDTRWTAPLSYFEEPLRVRALDAGGEIMAEIRVTPAWQRTGGTEECGGPSTAEVAVRL